MRWDCDDDDNDEELTFSANENDAIGIVSPLGQRCVLFRGFRFQVQALTLHSTPLNTFLFCLGSHYYTIHYLHATISRGGGAAALSTEIRRRMLLLLWGYFAKHLTGRNYGSFLSHSFTLRLLHVSTEISSSSMVSLSSLSVLTYHHQHGANKRGAGDNAAGDN